MLPIAMAQPSSDGVTQVPRGVVSWLNDNGIDHVNKVILH